MDCLWTWCPIRRRRSSSPAEPETPDTNEAKEKKKGKRKWKNIFSRKRKPKDAGKLLEEALEDKVLQQPEGDEGLELHSSLEDISPGVLEIHADTEAGALKHTSLDETRDDAERPLPVRKLEAEAKGKRKWKNIFSRKRKPKDAGKLLEEALEDKVLQQPLGDEGLELHSSLKDISPGVLEIHADTEAGALKHTSLDETRDDAKKLLPVRELEAVALKYTSLDETRDDAEKLLPVEELEPEAKALKNTSLDETRDDAEKLLPVRELEAEALKYTSLDETRDNVEKLLPVEKLESEAEALKNTSLDETRDDAEKLLPVEELESEAEALKYTSLDETRDDAEKLLSVGELEGEAEALKDLMKTILVESEETKLQNGRDSEADQDDQNEPEETSEELKNRAHDDGENLVGKGDDGGITGEDGRKKKTRRGTRGHGRKINHKKNDNEGSKIINAMNVEDEAEAEVAEIKNVHPDENGDLLNPDQPLVEEFMMKVLANTAETKALEKVVDAQASAHTLNRQVEKKLKRMEKITELLLEAGIEKGAEAEAQMKADEKLKTGCSEASEMTDLVPSVKKNKMRKDDAKNAVKQQKKTRCGTQGRGNQLQKRRQQQQQRRSECCSEASRRPQRLCVQ
ncbi:claspin-like isoform X2 [Trichomycterus rosablanca]|uniref:claspin-like isoform X2 n=1 Tax=Trichomycterus rosablanca TaxID=2290929 RepID=UPI002F35E137